MKKNVLITGGSGFIGSHVVDSLLKNKYRVKILDIQKPRRKDVKFIKGNILNKSIIRSALKDIDIIFHLAAVSDINKVKDIPKKTVETIGKTVEQIGKSVKKQKSVKIKLHNLCLVLYYCKK